MERKIGEIFEYNGEWYQCIRSSDCPKCDLKIIKDCKLKFPCELLQREDSEEVIFKKLEKVGEPYPNADKLYQLYKLPMNIEKLPPHTEGINLVRFVIVKIEIKQNKEDMEEKKLSLKPFNLIAAKQGKPVCTRDGRKARIICFDKKKDIYPLIALVTDKDGYEIITPYKADGTHPIILNNDLMMLSEKKERWVNVYKRKNEYIYEIAVYKSEGEAKRNIDKNRIYVNTIKINWEE